MLLHWEKHDLSLGMSPFMGSNYLRKIRPDNTDSRINNMYIKMPFHQCYEL